MIYKFYLSPAGLSLYDLLMFLNLRFQPRHRYSRWAIRRASGESVEEEATECNAQRHRFNDVYGASGETALTVDECSFSPLLPSLQEEEDMCHLWPPPSNPNHHPISSEYPNAARSPRVVGADCTQQQQQQNQAYPFNSADNSSTPSSSCFTPIVTNVNYCGFSPREEAKFAPTDSPLLFALRDSKLKSGIYGSACGIADGIHEMASSGNDFFSTDVDETRDEPKRPSVFLPETECDPLSQLYAGVEKETLEDTANLFAELTSSAPNSSNVDDDDEFIHFRSVEPATSDTIKLFTTSAGVDVSCTNTDNIQHQAASFSDQSKPFIYNTYQLGAAQTSQLQPQANTLSSPLFCGLELDPVDFNFDDINGFGVDGQTSSSSIPPLDLDASLSDSFATSTAISTVTTNESLLLTTDEYCGGNGCMPGVGNSGGSNVAGVASEKQSVMDEDLSWSIGAPALGSSLQDGVPGEDIPWYTGINSDDSPPTTGHCVQQSLDLDYMNGSYSVYSNSSYPLNTPPSD